MTGSNMDVNNENNRVGGRATRAGTTGRLTKKLLANPHSSLRKEPRWHILQAGDERQRYNSGEQWWDPATKKDPSLTKQCPLLDGGEDLLNHLPTFLHHRYASDFRVADDGFYTGRVAATTKGRETCWEHWAAYVAPMGVDPYLRDTIYDASLPPHRLRWTSLDRIYI